MRKQICWNRLFVFDNLNATEYYNDLHKYYHINHTAIHRLANRGTPEQVSKYKHALQMYKLFNSNSMSDDWVSLNDQQNFNGRNEHIQIFKKSNYRVGNNLLVNRFHNLNNKIEYSWFNDSFESFKIKCKNIFLKT